MYMYLHSSAKVLCLVPVQALVTLVSSVRLSISLPCLLCCAPLLLFRVAVLLSTGSRARVSLSLAHSLKKLLLPAPRLSWFPSPSFIH